MGDVMHFIRQYTVWLHHTLFEYGLFYIDLWSLVHFWSGMILFTALTALKWNNRWRWLVFFLFAFEVVEATIFISILKMFRPEKLPDSFTDIFVGLAGGYLVYFLFEKQKISVSYSKIFLYWLASGTVAFVWTGNSDYVISRPVFNVQGINWWVFLCWMAAGISILFLYERLKNFNSGSLRSTAISWIAYMPVMLFFFNLTSNLLYAGEAFTGGNSYFIKYIPTNGAKAFFYITSPLFFIGTYELLNSLFKKYFLKLNLYENT